LRYLSEILHGSVITIMSNPYNIAESVKYADLVIGAVLVPGAKAPKLVSREMISSMKTGSVIVDVAVDQGGCIETLRPTSHTNPTYVEEGVVHYGVPNMPGSVPWTATQALNNSTFPYVLKLANQGVQALETDSALAKGLNVQQHRLVHPAVREVFGDLAD
jgi:alanine dehydrogenase